MEPPIEREHLIRYLLGELPDREQETLEQRFFVDSDTFNQVESAEEDLIDLYVAGRLSARDHARFESYYLAGNEDRKRKVQFARSLRRYVSARPPQPEREPWWRALFGPVTLPRLALAGMAAGVVLIALFALRQKPAVAPSHPETAQQMPALPGPAPAAKPEEKLVAKATPIPSFDLSPILERGAGSIPAVSAGGASAVRLRLKLEQNEWQTYRAVLETAEGATLWTSPHLKAVGSMVSTQIPASALKPGDVVLRLRGTANGAEESVADYAFRVK